MKVDPSYITSQADAAHKRFIDAMQSIKTATGIEREFLLEDLHTAITLANHLKENYPQFITGQTTIRIAHMTARPLKEWLTFARIDASKNNLITTH